MENALLSQRDEMKAMSMQIQQLKEENESVKTNQDSILDLPTAGLEAFVVSSDHFPKSVDIERESNTKPQASDVTNEGGDNDFDGNGDEGKYSGALASADTRNREILDDDVSSIGDPAI
eukprot:11970250-Ditylum_brightwellii.AAC.1